MCFQRSRDERTGAFGVPGAHNLTKFCSRSWPWKSRPISESSRLTSLLPMGFNLLEQSVAFWVYLVANPSPSHRTSHAQRTYPRFGSSATARGSSPTTNGLGRRACAFGDRISPEKRSSRHRCARGNHPNGPSERGSFMRPVTYIRRWTEK